MSDFDRTVTYLPDGQGVQQINSVSSKWADDFGGSELNLTKWDVTEVTPGITYNVAGSILAITLGTTANAETHFLSKELVTIPADIYAVIGMSQRIVDNNVWFELVEVDNAGVPVVNPNNAAEWSNRAGVGFISSATAGAAQVETISDSSPAASAPVATTSWTSVTTVHEVHIEYRAQDTIAFGVGVDGSSSRTGNLRLSRSAPDPNKLYRFRIRVKNGATPPATSTVLSIYRVLQMDVQELTTEITGGRGDTAAGKAMAVITASTVNVQGAQGDNSTSVPTSAWNEP
jgi:hypothetical protein